MLTQAVFWLKNDDASRVDAEPFLSLIIGEVARHGVRDMVFVVEDGKRWGRLIAEAGERGCRARLAVAPGPTSIWGALRRVAHCLEARFYLLDGHSFFDINLLKFASEAAPFSLLCAFRRANAETSLAGVAAAVDATALASVFPQRSCDGGVRVVAKTLLAEFDLGDSSTEGDVYRKLAVEGRLGAMAFGSRFWDIRASAGALRSLSEHLRRPALFLDRDGVINVDSDYPHRPDQIEWIDGAFEAIRLANDRGYFVVVVTNQSGVARGFYDEASVASLHGWMQERFAEAGAHVDQFHYCPHHPEGAIPEYRRECDCRKPAPGMLNAAIANGVRREGSLLVGDRSSDLEAASRAGIGGHRFRGGNLKDFVEPLLTRWVSETTDTS